MPAKTSRYAYKTGDALHDALLMAAQASRIHLKPIRTPHITAPMDRLKFYLQHYQLAWRLVSLTPNMHIKYASPLLAFTKQENNPIVLLAAKTGGYKMISPSMMQPKKLDTEMFDSLDRTAIMFFRTFSEKSQTGKDLIRFGLQNNFRNLLNLMILTLLTGLIALTAPFAVKIWFSSIIPEKNYFLFFELCIIGIALIFLLGMLSYIGLMLILRVQTQLELALSAGFFYRLFQLPLSFFRNHSIGELMQQSLCINDLSQEIAHFLPYFMINSIVLIVNLIFMFTISPLLATIMAFFILIFFISIGTIAHYQSEKQTQQLELEGKVNNFLIDVLNGIAKLRVASAEMRAFITWGNLFFKWLKCSLQIDKLSDSTTMLCSIYFPAALLIFFLALIALNITLGISYFLTFFAALVLSLFSSLTLALQVVHFFHIKVLFKMSKPILHALPETKRHKTNSVNIEGKIEMNQVSFHYHPKNNWIIDKMSFEIKANEFVALIGNTGIGKTTVFRLLMGLETPIAGAIYFDDKDETDIDIHAIRSQIGHLDQNDKLIPGSILTNITGFGQHSEEEVWDTLDRVGLLDEIRAMPMGLHTRVGESAETISAGQKQRILLARVLIKHPKILLLDNSNSVLDHLSQSNIDHCLSQLTMTRLVITRRVSTLQCVDRILVLSAGRIIEAGAYHELLQSSHYFRKFLVENACDSGN